MGRLGRGWGSCGFGLGGWMDAVSSDGPLVARLCRLYTHGGLRLYVRLVV